MNQGRKTIFFPEKERTYRYVLWREWNNKTSRYAMIIGLNPSTADENSNDPTIRRCIGFAKSEGYGALCVANLFAFRATVPAVMKKHAAPIGPDNDEWLLESAKRAGIVIAAWGVDGGYLQRDAQVTRLLGKLWCLGKTKHHFPKHPLFIKKDTRAVPFNF